MKLCVFSDIHGNGPAFRAAHGAILAESADLNIFLGDLCGYYFDQLEIFELLRELPGLVALRGNHDQIFLDILAGDSELREKYLREYGASMESLLDSHGKIDLADWLVSLPASHAQPEKGLSCFHGSPRDCLEGYVYPDTPIETAWDISGSLFLLGHTHYRMERAVGEALVVNPGSLGQPRDGFPSSYAVIDLHRRDVSFRSVSYNRASLRKDLIRRGVTEGYLISILNRQREEA